MTHKKDNVVVKSNALLHASYQLTLIEKRTLLLAMVNGRDQDKLITPDTLVPVLAKDYSDIYQVRMDHAFEHLMNARKALWHRYVSFIIKDEDGTPEPTRVRWITKDAFNLESKLIRLAFTSEVINNITRLESEFQPYLLKQVAAMTSIYGMRLYEMMMAWKPVGQFKITPDDLRNRLELLSEYKTTKDFKRRVLDVAIQQINTYSDLDASYSQIKSGSKITHLVFQFNSKDGYTPSPETPPENPPKPAQKPRQPKALVLPEGFSQEQFAKYSQHREGCDAKLTKRTTKILFDELEIARAEGMSPTLCMEVAMKKPWKGFRAEWIRNALQSQQSQRRTKSEYIKEENERAGKAFLQMVDDRERDNAAIDITIDTTDVPLLPF